ncbi:hypothetical protein RND71_043480 [Anisodus tanguticus]|uniref:Uncharacterized protein n=1 Tax=Anisodus tanguticus TaxID=243964 RepID=A0AAE1UU18_9SOLA|nr:hypothetical protein RND71_043480 [Anisodus tanguticus]
MKKLSKDYSALKTKEQEELVELRRLRTENRLLRLRIENLEQESAELADKLIQGQVCRAQEAEDNYVIKRKLSVLSQREDELKVELEKAHQRVEQLKIEKQQCNAILGEETQLVIDSLQEELVAVKLREAENNDEMKQLRERINEMEEINKRLREVPPDHAVAQLQEELIAVKLREAEANLSMKELRLKISDLNNMWEEHLNSVHNTNISNINSLNGLVINSSSDSQPSSLDNSSIISNTSINGLNNTHSSLSISVSSSPLKMLGNSFKKSSEDRQYFNNEISRLKQEIMSAKLREAEAVAELKELRQKVMELETQNQVSLNQIRRQAEEINKFKDCEANFADKERQWTNKMNEEQRKFMDLDSRFKEQQVMNRIKDLEQTQLIAELKQKVSSFEVKKEETVTVEKLRQSGQEPTDNIDLQNRMAELQTEMFRLEVNRNKLNNNVHSKNNFSELASKEG